MKSSGDCENLSFLYKERRSTMLNQDRELRQQGLPTPELISRNGRCLDDRKSRGASSSFALRSSFSWNQTASYGQMIAIKTVAAPAIFYWAKSQFNVKNMQTIRNACNWVPIGSSSTAEGGPAPKRVLRTNLGANKIEVVTQTDGFDSASGGAKSRSQ
jgi:hypothetical protein